MSGCDAYLLNKSPARCDRFSGVPSPKWNHDNDGELIDDASRCGRWQKSKATYEDGMFRAFQACHQALKPRVIWSSFLPTNNPMLGKLLYQPLYEQVLSLMVVGQFNRNARWTQLGRASCLPPSGLSARSVQPRHVLVGTTRFLEEMRTKIRDQLREFWDAGIRGPDFVWAATGPALEAYSKHPVVKKANDPGDSWPSPSFSLMSAELWLTSWSAVCSR